MKCCMLYFNSWFLLSRELYSWCTCICVHMYMNTNYTSFSLPEKDEEILEKEGNPLPPVGAVGGWSGGGRNRCGSGGESDVPNCAIVAGHNGCLHSCRYIWQEQLIDKCLTTRDVMKADILLLYTLFIINKELWEWWCGTTCMCSVAYIEEQMVDYI